MSLDRLVSHRGLDVLMTENFGYFFGRLAQLGHLREVTYAPPLGSPLWHQDHPVRLPVDQVIAPVTLASGQWEVEELDFLRRHLHPERACTLIDVGANIGLFARQVLAALPQVRLALCYEPQATHLAALRYNLATLPARIHPAALGPGAGHQALYVDATNIGNASLLPHALYNLAPNACSSQQVEVRDAATEAESWLACEGPLVYKSDTQGADPWLACQYPQAFWERVDVAILELWRLSQTLGADDESRKEGAPQQVASPEPAPFSLHPQRVDRKAFARVLDAFPYKAVIRPGLGSAWGQAVLEPWTTPQVLDYLQGDDGAFVNLGLWRDPTTPGH